MAFQLVFSTQTKSKIILQSENEAIFVILPLNDNSIELISAINLPSELGVFEVGGGKVLDIGVSI